MELKEQIVHDINTHYSVTFKDVNVLEDPMIRVKLSEHSNWLNHSPVVRKRRINWRCRYYQGTAPEWTVT